MTDKLMSIDQIDQIQKHSQWRSYFLDSALFETARAAHEFKDNYRMMVQFKETAEAEVNFLREKNEALEQKIEIFHQRDEWKAKYDELVNLIERDREEYDSCEVLQAENEKLREQLREIKTLTNRLLTMIAELKTA